MVMSIVWAIIGIVLIAVGFSMMQVPLYSAPHQPMIRFQGSAIVGLVVALVGYVILLLGTLASFLKYSAEYYAEEMRKTPYPQQPQYYTR